MARDKTPHRTTEPAKSPNGGHTDLENPSLPPRDEVSRKEAMVANLCEAYRAAARGEALLFEPPLDISLLIGSNGLTQITLPLPGGLKIGKICGIGLPTPSSNPQIDYLEQASDAHGVWVTFSALDKENERKSSRVLLLYGKTGQDAIRTEQDVQADALRALYEQAAEGAVTTGLPLDISLLIGSSGKTQITLPLPGGLKIGKQCRIGLPKDLASCSVTDILHLSDNRFRLTFVGKTSSGSSASTRVVISPEGIIRPVESTQAVEIAKGHALDRYVAHLFAASDTTGLSSPFYSGSPLTGERFMPNIASGETLVHSKWGNDASDVLEYIQRYARLRRWNGALSGAVHLVAARSHMEELKAALEALQREVSAPATVVTDLTTWAAETLGIDSTDIDDELERISAMASTGDLQWLSERTYEPTLPVASRSSEQPALSWQERVEALSRTSEVIDVLRVHNEHHSLYWERSYHLELVRHCSYLIDQALSESPLSPELKEEANRLVHDLYPALERYPHAWRFLDEGGANQGAESDDGKGSSPILTPFNLERELARLGMTAQPLTTMEAELDWRHPHDVGPKVHEIFSRHISIEAALYHLKIELAPYPDDIRALTYRECVSWIAAVTLDVHLLHQVPESLLRAKGASDQGSVFLKELSQLPPDERLYYLCGGQRYFILAQKLRDGLSQLDPEARR